MNFSCNPSALTRSALRTPLRLLGGLLLATQAAQADIFQWEYINPGDPGQGKQQSTTLCPDGAGQFAEPGSSLYGDLTMAYLIGADLSYASGFDLDLTDADLSQANVAYAYFYAPVLNGANFSQANLAGASLESATLAGANFTGAQVQGTYFGYTDLMTAQLYSTASYQQLDLTGIGLYGNDLSGWEFAGQNLTNAYFNDATLAGANFAGAHVQGGDFSGTDLTTTQLYSTSSYQSQNLTGIILNGNNLSGWNFAGQNLTNANLTGSILMGANFTGAQVEGASFSGGGTGLTPAQLYSTASYQTYDLTGMYLSGDLSGWNFSGQDLTGAFFLGGTNLTSALFYGATLTDANFSGAQVQGANFSSSNLTTAQLYSTGSYFDLDLSGIILAGNDLSDWSFNYMNLTGADLSQVNLTGANLLGATLASANLSQANLTNADLSFATLTGANFANAQLQGVVIYDAAGFTAAQLYSTANYQAHELPGIFLYGEFSGWNFAGQNLTNASLGGNLTNADFGQANLTNAYLWSATLSGTNLSQANLTGANLSQATLTSANLSQANLTDADLSYATLTGANFTDALVKGANLEFTTIRGLTAAQLYSTASYQAQDLAGINLVGNNLTGWNFAGQNLTNAIFAGTTLTGANFTNALVQGANFVNATGFTVAQLYSTASYQEHDLAGIVLAWNNLSGANLAGQDLTNASFNSATLTGVDFTGAHVQGVDFSFTTLTGFTAAQLYSTASYAAHDLTGISLYQNGLIGWNFSGQNLTNADLSRATVTNADFSNAVIQGASFSFATGFTLAQLYSTASYQSGNLTGIMFERNDLSGATFVGHNLSNASFREVTLTDANFSHANLTNAEFFGAGFWLAGANLTGADARGASISQLPPSATTTNLIRPDGHISGLYLDGGGLLVVRDYDGDNRFESAQPPIPITIDQQLAMGPGGALRMVFEADAWGSTISFAPGIPVTLGGTLELTFAAGMSLAGQVGRTFDLFDWTGVNPTGAFSVSSPYTWNLANLYTMGEVTLLAVPGLPGDFNHDGTVDAADYVVWRKNFGDDQTKYGEWRTNFGRTLSTDSGVALPSAEPLSAAIPEPSTILLLAFGAVAGLIARRRFRAVRTFSAVAIAVGLLAAPATTHAAALRTVALSGQPAPGTPSDVNFGNFRFLSSNGVYFGPVLNDTGQVAFGGGLTGSGVDATNRIGIWSEGSGALALVARRGNQAPGAPDGATFNDFGNRDLANFLLFNNAGQTAFSATLAGSATGVGIWSEGSGSLAVVARSGQQAPGAPDGATFSYSVLDFPRMPVLNNRGQVTFTAGADGCCRGMWSDRSGSLMPIALTGDPAPGLPSGVSFISFASPQAFFNDVGQTAFYASLTGTAVDSSNSRSIWSEGSGSLALVARAGDQAPGMPADVHYWNFQHPVMNNTGHVAFQAWVTSNTTGGQEAIFSSASSSVASIASLGQSAPGTPPGVTFYHFLNYPFPILNNAGHVAFRAELHGEGVQSGINNHGIWLERDGSVELVARTGDHAPGTPDDVTFGGFDLHWFYRHLPFLNDAGQIAFSAMLKGSGVDTGNDHGIWASDRTGELQLITRSGDQLEVAPGDFRTIADLDLGSSFIANQPRPSTSSSFNNLGQLAFWASFTDGSSGIFVSNRVAIPEPSAILLIAFGIAPVFVRWNRSR